MAIPEKVITIRELGINVQYTYDEASAVGVWNVWTIEDELSNCKHYGCLYTDGSALMCHMQKGEVMIPVFTEIGKQPE